MAKSKNKSSGIGSAMGPIGGMIPGMKQASQASQLLSDPKGTANNMAQEMAKKVIKKIAKQVAKKIVTSILTNPYVLAAIGIVIVVVVFFLIIIAVVTGQGNSSTTQSNFGQLATPSAQAGPPPTTSNDVLSWGAQILSAVQPFPAPCGQMYINNVMLQTITNGNYTAKQRPGSVCGIGGSSYYCTDLVIDAYNLAGIKNNFSRGVAGMIVQWASMIPGATVRKSSNVDGLQPGDAVFWLTTNNTLTAQHVAIIQSINVSQNGNGTLTTIDSNTNHKTNTFAVHNWILDGHIIGGLTAWFGLQSR